MISSTASWTTDASRSALLEILAPSALEWDKAELCAWLAGAYRAATHVAVESCKRGEIVVPRAARFEASAIRTLIADAWAEARSRILAIPHGNTSIVDDAIWAGAVVQVDPARALHAPVDLLRMRLVDRILSLAAADYLTCPDDYEDGLGVCTECGAFSFCDETRASGACHDRTPQSWIRGTLAIDPPQVVGIRR